MDSSSQIDTVQKFAEVIGDHDNLWKILIGKEVSRFEETVIYYIRYKNAAKSLKNNIHQEDKKLVQYYAQGKVVAIHNIKKETKILIEINYDTEFSVKYKKWMFVKQFNIISPPLFLEDILPLIEIEEDKKRLDAERLEAEKREIERQEAQRLEAEKREAERREAQRLEAEKREAERREAQRLETERRKIKKLSLLENIKDEFENNFFNADNFYQLHCTEYISFQEYKSEKSKYIQNWVKTNLNFSHDLEQAAAIGTIENHVQVIARAGSGKTSTLVNRAIFLQKHCGIAPGEMLLLAFNRKAAEEMRERLTLQLQNSVPHVMTFHALAYALVHPENILFDEPDGEQNQSRALQIIIDQYLQHPIFYAKIRDLMTAAFHEDWERIISGGYDKTPEEILRYRRSLPREGIDGNYYKSFGEKLIANFLFEHNIKYKYERNFWWNGINYRPDFTILTGEKQGIVIEYFGLEGDPDYDDMSPEKREYWANRPN